MDIINRDFESGFKLESSGYQLGGKPSQPPVLVNRSTVTSREIGETFYQVSLHRVQYGTFKAEKASLITFNVAFDFRGNTRGRFTSATVTASFASISEDALQRPYQETEDDDLEGDGGTKTLSRPHILRIIPRSIYGNPSPQAISKQWDLKVNLGISEPTTGAAAGVTAGFGVGENVSRDARMSIIGSKRGSRGRQDGDDIAVWVLEENSVQRDGIPHSFQVAVVLKWPAQGGVVAFVDVKTKVEFSVSHLLASLRPKKEYPVAFDGKTLRGDGIELDKDFDDATFDWAKAIELPAEYQTKI